MLCELNCSTIRYDVAPNEAIGKPLGAMRGVNTGVRSPFLHWNQCRVDDSERPNFAAGFAFFSKGLFLQLQIGFQRPPEADRWNDGLGERQKENAVM
jgi:hypothetical protein